MEEKDLRSLSQLSKGFWFDPEVSLDSAKESLAQVAFLNLSSQLAHDQTARLMLQKAIHDGQIVNRKALNHPFYRLSAEERFLLSALHYGDLSYQRVAHIIGLPLNDVARLAAQTRLKLAFDLRIPIPVVPTAARQTCPHYDTNSPWPERFLDEQVDEEHGTLQNHLMACPICQACLSKYREYYYQIEKQIPHLEKRPLDASMITGETKNENQSELDQTVIELSKMISKTRQFMNHTTSLLQKSFETVFSRRDVQILSGIFILWTLYLLVSP